MEMYCPFSMGKCPSNNCSSRLQQHCSKSCPVYHHLH